MATIDPPQGTYKPEFSVPLHLYIPSGNRQSYVARTLNKYRDYACVFADECEPPTKTCMFVVDFDCESEQSIFCNAPADNRYMPGDLWMCDEHREKLAGAYSDTMGKWEKVSQ